MNPSKASIVAVMNKLTARGLVTSHVIGSSSGEPNLSSFIPSAKGEKLLRAFHLAFLYLEANAGKFEPDEIDAIRFVASLVPNEPKEPEDGGDAAPKNRVF